jgi:hypothetical protein
MPFLASKLAVTQAKHVYQLLKYLITCLIGSVKIQFFGIRNRKNTTRYMILGRDGAQGAIVIFFMATTISQSQLISHTKHYSI